MSVSIQQKVMLNDVLVDFISLKIKVQGAWVDVESKQMALLALLLAHQGKAVSRELIMDTLWSGLIVSDNSVSQLVTQLRKSLHDNKNQPQIIRTIPRVGYQLIAEVSEPASLLAHVNDFSPKQMALFAGGGVIIGVLFSLFIQYVIFSQSPTIEFNYVARATSAPGTEAFLSYSPDGRYLAFSQSDEAQNQFDLAVFDQQTDTVHSVKSSGYSEEAPVWSPDGRWLAYYRYDALSCDIRVIAVNSTIETWRLSPEFTLNKCQPFSSPSRLKWPKPDVLIAITWHENQPRLVKYTLSTDAPIKVINTDFIGEFSPIAFDINANEMLLIAHKQGIWYTLTEVDLNDLQKQKVLSRQLHRQQPIAYNHLGSHVWSVEDELKYISPEGEKQTLYRGQGFIASLAINPVNGSVAHAEGLAQMNAYQLRLIKKTDGVHVDKEVQLASSTRIDLMPTLSKDGSQVAFISLQRTAKARYTYAEVWVKHQRRKSASLVAHLPNHMMPKYLAFSPDGDTLLLLDEANNLYLINLFSRKLVNIVSGFKQLNAVRWSEDSQAVLYQANSAHDEWQDWRYDLQLNSNSLIANNVTARTLPASEPLWHLNRSYIDYQQSLRLFLSAALEKHVPLAQLLSSIDLYKPALFDGGVYYVLREGHQLSLYCYFFASQNNVFIKKLGTHSLNVGVDLALSSSVDGTKLVFSRLDGVETDILLHQIAN